MQFVECDVCKTPKLPLEFIHLPCAHKYCKSCIISFWTVKIESNAIELNCPSACELKLNPNQYIDLFDQVVVSQFKNNIKKYNAVQNNNIICNNCKVEHKTSTQECIKCECNTEICSKCGYKYHEYESCEHYIIRTQDKIHVDMSKKDSKCCPKCNTIINKNGGCDHMNCTLCKHKFNWSECINKQETDMELALHKLTALALKYTRPFN